MSVISLFQHFSPNRAHYFIGQPSKSLQNLTVGLGYVNVEKKAEIKTSLNVVDIFEMILRNRIQSKKQNQIPRQKLKFLEEVKDKLCSVVVKS